MGLYEIIIMMSDLNPIFRNFSYFYLLFMTDYICKRKIYILVNVSYVIFSAMLHTRMNRRRKHFVDKVHPAVCINYLFLYFEKRHGCHLRTRGSMAVIGTPSFKHSCGNMQWSICFLLIDALIQSKLRTVYMHFLYDIL